MSIPSNICWSWRRLEAAFKKYLKDVFNTHSPQQLFNFTIFCKNCYIEDVFKTFWGHALQTLWYISWRRLEDALKTCLEDVFKTSWRQMKYLLGISVSSKSKCVYLWSNKSISNKCISDKSKANQKCINYTQ